MKVLSLKPSLIKNKKIVSLFVNPLQFNNPDDYKSYPKSIDSDITILERNKSGLFIYAFRE